MAGFVGQNTDVDASAEALTSSTVCQSVVTIKALPGNSNVVYVGLADTVSATTGFPLSAGQEMTVGAAWFRAAADSQSDLADIYVIGGAANQGVAFWGI